MSDFIKITHYNNQRIESADLFLHEISAFGNKPAFSNFFPGLAGLEGTPLWAYYANRGQAISSFGIRDKDGAIMEFQPANKAYEQTPLLGFRTFLRLKNGTTRLWEPFSAWQGRSLENTSMAIRPWDLEIRDQVPGEKLAIRVRYFGLPGEAVAGLVREVTIENLSDEQVSMQIMDGLPKIMMNGTQDKVMKNMSRTIEAWSLVENRENNVPMFHLRASSDDSQTVEAVKGCNFSFSVNDKGEFLNAVTDPDVVFGSRLDFSWPEKFVQDGFQPNFVQHNENKTACSMFAANIKVQAGASRTFRCVYGWAPVADKVLELAKKSQVSSQWSVWEEKNKTAVLQLLDRGFLHSGIDRLSAYAGQNFLDNSLRGGTPVLLGESPNQKPVYLFSRKHGDPERDYNSFRLEPEALSQGNGAYRDVNQNRRNDAWYHRGITDQNIRTFMSLIQLDGFNPLTVKGTHYTLDQESLETAKKLFAEPALAENVLRRLGDRFSPGELYAALAKDFSDALALSGQILSMAEPELDADHGEGFWIDHWHYNLDSIESFESLYPDKALQALAQTRDLPWFDNANVVGDIPGEFQSVLKDKEKYARINQRVSNQHWARQGGEEGGVLRSTVLEKLVILAAIKFLCMDEDGRGMAMDAGKPGWNDSLNGLPGLAGSSSHESMALLRLVTWLEDKCTQTQWREIELLLPTECSDLLSLAIKFCGSVAAGNSEEKLWNWALRRKTIKDYRLATRMGVSTETSHHRFSEFQAGWTELKKALQRSMRLCLNHDTGCYDGYFYLEPGKPDGSVRKALPLFLESQVHAMRVEPDLNRRKDLHLAVLDSGLYDQPLGMFKTNISLADEPKEVGRSTAFTPGWLENESIFVHMEYKYLLELLRGELYEEFFQHLKTAAIPFLDPEVYGRPVFENSSFIASSANPDPRVVGRGFCARLSGSTAEFCHMLLLMFMGSRPFVADSGGLRFEPRPLLPDWIYSQVSKARRIQVDERSRVETFESGTAAMMLFGATLLTVHRATGGGGRVVPGMVKRWGLVDHDGNDQFLDGPVLEGQLALDFRAGLYSRVDLWL